jgi:hypothetical protein
MMAGTRLRIATQTIALDVIDGRRTIIMIPADEILTVIAPPHTKDKMIDVMWYDRTIEMFAVDLAERGTEIAARAAAA